MVPTIFWSAHAEGVLKKTGEHLDPDGCLVQQCGHRTYEDAAKAAEDTGLIRQQNRVSRMGCNFAKKKLRGEVHFLLAIFQK